MNFFDELLRKGPAKRDERRLPDALVPLMQRPLYRPDGPNVTGDDALYSPTALPGYELILDAIDITLMYLQHNVRVMAGNTLRVWFPFEFSELKVGTKIYDASMPKNVYTVKDVDNELKGVYNLTGNNDPPDKRSKLFVDGNDRIRFMVGYPNSEDSNQYAETAEMRQLAQDPMIPTVTYRVIRVEPAGQQGYFTGTRDISPRLVGSFKYEDGTDAEVESQRFDVEIQFSCWMTTNVGAVDLARWFREAMAVIIPVLRGHGLENGHFWKQEQDIHLTKWRNDIVARSHVYMFRVAEAKALKAYPLKHVSVQTVVQQDGEIGADYEVQV